MRALILLGASLCLSAVGAAAQRPDLSGTWAAATAGTPAAIPSALPVAPGPIFGARFALAIDATAVQLTRPTAEISSVAILPLDGSRARTAPPPRLCEGERIFHESVAWEGDALVLTLAGTTPAGGNTMVESGNRTIFRLESRDRLVVEATMVRQGERTQVGWVYERSALMLPPRAMAPAVQGVRATIADAAWIGETWVGTTGALTTEERWTPPASGGMMATARTLRGPALAGFEFLCIAERGGSLAYLAMPSARSPATVFMATEVTPTSITFENPAHDFPKMIRYALTPEGALETTTAGENGARAQKVVLQRRVP